MNENNSLTFAQKLCSILAEMKVITLAESKAMQDSFQQSPKERFDYFLLEEGIVSEKDLLKALSILYKVPSMDVNGIFFDTMILREFPKDTLLRLGAIPYCVDENILILIVNDPSQEDLATSLGRYVSYDLQFYVGLRRDIEDKIKEYYDKSVTQVNEDEYMEETDLDDYEAYQEEELLDDESLDATLDNDDDDIWSDY